MNEKIRKLAVEAGLVDFVGELEPKKTAYERKKEQYLDKLRKAQEK